MSAASPHCTAARAHLASNRRKPGSVFQIQTDRPRNVTKTDTFERQRYDSITTYLLFLLQDIVFNKIKLVEGIFCSAAIV